MNQEQIKHDQQVRQNEAFFVAQKNKERRELEQIEKNNKLDFSISNSNQDIIETLKTNLKKLFESIDQQLESDHISENTLQNITEAIETANDLREALDDKDKQDKLDDLITDKLDDLKDKSEVQEHDQAIVEMFSDAKDSYINDNQIEISPETTKQVELER